MYYIGLSLSDDTKRAIEEFRPTVLHIANPDPVAGMCIMYVLITSTSHSSVFLFLFLFLH